MHMKQFTKVSWATEFQGSGLALALLAMGAAGPGSSWMDREESVVSQLEGCAVGSLDHRTPNKVSRTH